MHPGASTETCMAEQNDNCLAHESHHAHESAGHRPRCFHQRYRQYPFTTDLNGDITYVNPDFIKISGFDED